MLLVGSGVGQRTGATAWYWETPLMKLAAAWTLGARPPSVGVATEPATTRIKASDLAGVNSLGRHYRPLCVERGQLEVDDLLGLRLGHVEVVGVGAGRQVLPAAVAHDEHDRALVDLARRPWPRRPAPRPTRCRRTRRTRRPGGGSTRSTRGAARCACGRAARSRPTSRTPAGCSPRRGCAGPRPARRAAARRR